MRATGSELRCWLKLARTEAPPRPSSKKLLVASRRFSSKSLGPFHSKRFITAQGHRSPFPADADAVYRFHPMTPTTASTKQPAEPWAIPSYHVLDHAMPPPGALQQPSFPTIIGAANSRPHYISPSELEKWLADAEVGAGPSGPAITSVTSESPDLVEEHATAEAPASAPDELFSMPASQLDELTEEELVERCRHIGSQGTHAHTNSLIAHFERDARSASKKPASELADSEHQVGLRRRHMGLNALLAGLAYRHPVSSGPTDEATFEGHRQESPPTGRAVPVFSAEFAKKAGIEAQIPPSQLVRIHQLLRQSSEQLVGSRLVFEIEPQLCYLLATRVSISGRHQLFQIFLDMMHTVTQSETWQQCFSDSRELVFLLKYCLDGSAWDEGGSRLVQSVFQLLLSRSKDDTILKQVEQDAKTWMPDESRRSRLIHLFAHLALVRYSLVAGLPREARNASNATNAKFSKLAADPRTPAKFVWTVCSSMLGDGPKFRSDQKGEMPSHIFEEAKTLLLNNVRGLASIMPGLTASSAPLLESACLHARHVHRPTDGLQLLQAFMHQGIRTNALVASDTLVRLLLSAPDDQRVPSFLHSLLGTNRIKNLSEDSAFVSVPHTLRPDLIVALCQYGLRRQAASLFLHWVQTDESNRIALVSDRRVMTNLVRFFSRRPGHLQLKVDRKHAFSEGLLQRRESPSTANDGLAFCVELIETFRYCKPLRLCDRFDLTALASAYFFIGHEENAFAIFRRLLHHRHVPAGTDLTVLMRALASADLGKAVRLYISNMASANDPPANTPSPAEEMAAGANDESESAAEQNAEMFPSFLRGFEGNHHVLIALLEGCFEEMDASSLELLLNHSKRFKPDLRFPDGRSVALTIDVVRRAWTATRQEPRRGWDDVMSLIANWRKEGRLWNPPTPILKSFVEAAVNGLSLKELLAKKQERRKPEELNTVASMYFKASQRLSPDRLSLSIGLLEAMEQYTCLTPKSMIDMFLHRLHQQTETIGGKGTGPRSDQRTAAQRTALVAEVDRVVSVIRHMEARVSMVPFAPSMAHDHDQAVAGSGARAEEGEEATEADLADGARISPLQPPPPPHAMSGSRPLPRSAIPASLMNPLFFRSLIRLYLSLSDIQGASEVFLWMQSWFAAGSFRSGKLGVSITGEAVVRLGLGHRIANEHIKPILGDLRMLNQDQVPSWTFEGNRIEKTKKWWFTNPVPSDLGADLHRRVLRHQCGAQ